MAGRATISDVGLVALLWRALAVFRVAAVGYAIALIMRDIAGFARPGYGWLAAAVMLAWTAVVVWAYARPAGRRWPVLVTDLLVAIGALSVSGWVMGPQEQADTLPAVWVAAPVMAWAIRGGWQAGTVAALLVAVVDFAIRDTGGGIPQVTISATVLLLFAGAITGYLARLAGQAERQLQEAAQREAATRERERLARGIHDSVLQVLALVQRRGNELGGEAAQLGRLAGEQEATLRALVAGDGPLVGAGDEPQVAAASTAGQARRGGGALTDLRQLLNRYVSGTVSLSVPAEPVLLPTDRATELAAAAGAALDNVATHCGPHALAWVLVEAEPDAVTVTVRDDGPGIPAGRLAQAAADGRLGVAQSIQGRLRDLGGTATITSAPGQGTEVELRLPLP